MSRSFEILGVPPRPRPEAEAVRTAYLRLAGTSHPDASGGSAASFERVREAFEILKDPSKRLAELAGGTGETVLPSNELFSAVADAVAAAGKIGGGVPRSPLARAVAVQELRGAREALTGADRRLQEAEQSAEAELDRLDRNWPHVAPEELQALSAAFRFLRRWRRQLDEQTHEMLQKERLLLSSNGSGV